MRVFVDSRKVDLQPGMKVKHALSVSQLKAVRSGKMDVTDSDGNTVGLEGSLTEGSRLRTKRSQPRKS
jgi:hypothetical protein